jgi:hypothetical protein
LQGVRRCIAGGLILAEREARKRRRRRKVSGPSLALAIGVHHTTRLFDDLRRFIERFSVAVVLERMDIEKPGEFDGLTITINPKHDANAASYYLAHAFGSIVQWSTAPEMARRVYEGLRTAKRRCHEDSARFDQALEEYRTFEQTSSEHAVWILAQIGHRDSIADYTRFFRADIEAMTIFHRTGKAPSWPEFYADWSQKVAAGEIRIESFTPRPFPPFRPRRIEHQDVLQERD